VTSAEALTPPPLLSLAIPRWVLHECGTGKKKNSCKHIQGAIIPATSMTDWEPDVLRYFSLAAFNPSPMRESRGESGITAAQRE
uniref:Uncharacterized protein n=1 Tax=Stegastes partitus TaxID=144197 RepID=A0A3B4Z3C8_9TELE